MEVEKEEEMKNRGRIELITKILQAAGSGNSMTRIMYAVSLSSRPLKEYLRFSQERGFLTYDQRTRQYSLTEKGLRFIEVGDLVGRMIVVSDEEEEEEQEEGVMGEGGSAPARRSNRRSEPSRQTRSG